VLELSQQDLGLFVVLPIFRSLFGDVHLKIIHFSLQILQDQFLSIVFMLDCLQLRLGVLHL